MNILLNGVMVVTGLGLAAAIILVAFSKIMEVKTDETVERVREALPGANCGACGYAGCDEYAKAVAAGQAEGNLCVPGGAKTAEEIAGITGRSSGAVAKRVAVVACRGNSQHTRTKMAYQGISTCHAANRFFAGDWVCPDGCLGHGDCVSACMFGAISVQDGVAVVDRELCTGCGACVKRCPNHLLRLVDDSKASAYVLCRNHQKGGVTRKGCDVGCIGCQKCARICPVEAIHMEENLAVVDPAVCIDCGKCIGECPTGAITRILAD